MERARHFLRRMAAFCLLGVFVVIASAGVAPAKKKAKRSSSTSTAGKRTKTAGSQSASSGSARGRSRKVVVVRKKVNGRWVRVTQVVKSESGPSSQPHPDPERYQQIQQALAANGYFKGTANGQWGEDSVAALKQFQTDQKIPNDGRISSLSLIDLGLGPHRETVTAPAPVATPPPASN